jgi:hypothetical protein
MIEIFLLFQKEANVKRFSNIAKDYNEAFYLAYLKEECRNFPRKYQYSYTIIDDDLPVAFFFFDINASLSRSANLQFAFKDSRYTLNKEGVKIFSKMLENFKEKHNIDRIYACLGARDREQSYIKLVEKKFGAKLVSKDQFNRPIVELYGKK